MNYFYFGAALPGLTMDSKPAITQEEFNSLAAEHLCPSDLAALKALDGMADSKGAHPFVDTWRTKETSLRNSLARARAAALKTDAEKYLEDGSVYDGQADRVANEALSRSNPLEKERVLDSHRWATLDEMGGFDPFSTQAILAYSLKLAIAERWSSFDEKQGSRIADRVLGVDASISSSETNENSE